MIKKYALGPLKFLLVDSTANIVGDLLEQPWPVWIFLGWGWLSMLVMVTSLVSQALQL